MTWRVGRKLRRTVYHQLGEQPSDDDILVGFMETAALAQQVVDEHNRLLP